MNTGTAQPVRHQRLEEYHKRSYSESGFAQDKKLLGWTVAQRRDDGTGCALFSMELWCNLFNLAS